MHGVLDRIVETKKREVEARRSEQSLDDLKSRVRNLPRPRNFFSALTHDPLENIRNSESIGMVMMNGRLYDGKTLAEIGATKRPAPRFWWE